MSERASPEVERVLREAVLDQIANNEPPEAALTLARLASVYDPAWRVERRLRSRG